MVPYLRAANVTWRGIDLSDVKKMDFSVLEVETYRLRTGDILLAEASGSPSEVGKPAIYVEGSDTHCFQNTLIRVRSTSEVNRFLHAHFLRDVLLGRFAKTARGVGIQHLGADALSAWEIALPPVGEQERIVEALDSYLTRLDDAVASLERAQAKLKAYRASVLKAAVEGRLVPTEAVLARAEKRDYEPADVLLARILKERRHRWEEAELDRLKKAGKTPKDDKWTKKYEEPLTPDTTTLPQLPEGWRWATVDMFGDVKGGLAKGQKRSPKERLLEVPYLRVANVQRGYLDLSEVKTILATAEEITELRLQPGDVLFNEGGDRDKLGRGWIWSGEIAECIHQNHVFRVRLTGSDVEPRFVSWYGNSSGQRYFFDEGKQTTNLASINMTQLKSLPVPVPPSSEQARIVDEVEDRLSVVDEVVTSVTHDIQRCLRLRQAVLKWAFEGKLVDQEPSDEAAETLLARLKAERAAAVPVTKANGRRRKGAA